MTHSSSLLQARHDSGDGNDDVSNQEGIMTKWRQKERLKTTAVALVLCLNIGVDPPDVMKISPCARLECWVDPLSMQPQKALDIIGLPLKPVVAEGREGERGGFLMPLNTVRI